MRTENTEMRAKGRRTCPAIYSLPLQLSLENIYIFYLFTYADLVLLNSIVQIRIVRIQDDVCLCFLLISGLLLLLETLLRMLFKSI